ncbi:hypothetical protein ACLPD8_18265 [Proteus mirabilis]|uniref:hypothetical protein n=1 Tax=Proteus mirabilis TaxID=584 RepID=UPI003D2D72DC
MYNAKKGATYGGFFGLTLGTGAGLAFGGSWLVSKGEVAAIAGLAGLVAFGAAGAIANTGIGFFRPRSKQQYNRSVMQDDKLQHTNQASTKM